MSKEDKKEKIKSLKCLNSVKELRSSISMLNDKVLDSFEYVKEFDYLYLKIVVKLYRVIGVDEYDDNNSFNTFSRIGRKWYANWINPDGLSIKIDDILNYKVDSQYIRLLKE